MDIERTIFNFRDSLWSSRRVLFWIFIVGLFIWLAFEVKEITSLLLLSYVIALLIDPLVSKLQRRRIPRGLAIVGLGFAIISSFFILIVVALPPVVAEYNVLIASLPGYLDRLAAKASDLSVRWLGKPLPLDPNAILVSTQRWLSTLGSEQLRRIAIALGGTLLQGYSLTLTLLNIFLLPFFVFYIGRDLHEIHRFIGKFIRDDIEVKIKAVADDILEHVYAFFRGQITVCVILALCYVLVLWLVGLPYAFVVGMLAGLLNIVPYLGLTVGLLLATILTLVNDPSLTHLLMVWSAFGVVQILEGTVLTPRFVGASVGLHPLAAMLALIVGGQLFGLIGLIIAIPGAAACIVLFKELRRSVESGTVETMV